MAVDVLLFVNWLKAILELPNRFGSPKKQHASGTKCKMKQREDLLLRAGLQVDQHVPAGNQIEPRERRVCQEILDSEDHGVAQITHNAKTAALGDKKPAQAFRACYLRFALRSINACTRKSDRVGVHIGRKDLKLDGAL